MTRYTGNEPIEPFVVIAKTVKCSVDNGDKGGSGGGTLPSAKSSTLDLGELDSTVGKIVAAAVLAVAYMIANARPMFTQVTILILPVVVLYRLDPRRRRIAAAPIFFATMMLASKIGGGDAGYLQNEYGIPASAANLHELRIWMPLLLAGCLFYMPKFPTCTERILLVLSLVLLLSGLLPGAGFGIIFVTTRYFLFLAIAVGLGVDLTQNGRMFSAETSPAGK